MQNINTKSTLLILILTIATMYQSCAEKNKTLNTTTDTIITKIDTIIFKSYRNISQDLIDSMTSENIPQLFGIWSVSSIANIGGTLLNDSVVFEQLNKKLYFNDSKFQFFFLGDTINIENPVYKVKYIEINDNIDLGFTTFFYGYEPCRKDIIMIDISKKIQLEITNYEEMAYFYDGRIYFLSKLNP